MRLKLEEQTGFFEQPVHRLKRQPLPGSQQAADKAFAKQFDEQVDAGSWLTSGFVSPRVLDIKPGRPRSPIRQKPARR